MASVDVTGSIPQAASLAQVCNGLIHHPDNVARTQPTKHRPGTSYKVYEGDVTLYGTAYPAIVVHSNTQDKRRQQRLERAIQASYSTLQSAMRTAAQQEYFCRADAEAEAVWLTSEGQKWASQLAGSFD